MKINEFKLEEFFAKYEFSVKYVLCASDCESFSIEELLSLERDGEENFKRLRLGYTETQGHPELREEISKLYDDINKEEVLVFSGAEEGIFIFFNTFLSKGDHVIVQFPAYQSLFEIANSLGCEVTKWEMNEENKWDLDINFLVSSIKKNTKVIVINSPHNPTGSLFSKMKNQEIIKIALENDIRVFSDEVYRFSEHDEKDRLKGACDFSPKCLSLGVMSKSFGLPGLRIGWIASKDEALLRKMVSFKNYTTICNSAPSEYLSILALRNKVVILKRNRNIILENLKVLDIFFKNHDDIFEWIRPKAGPIAFPRLIIEEDIEQFCLNLLREKRVLLMPGTNFDFGMKHFRIGFGRKNMPEALNLFDNYLKRYN